MSEIAFILFMIALLLVGIGVIVHIIGVVRYNTRLGASFNMALAGIAILMVGIIFGTNTIMFTIGRHQIEYVECEHCGERIPKEQYEKMSE